MVDNSAQNAHEAERRLAVQFADLRRGWGLGSSALGGKVGPDIARLAGVPPMASNQEIKRRVAALVERLLRGGSEEDRVAALVSLGLDPGARLSQLTTRTQELARRLHCSERGARRKISRAFALLAQTGAAELSAPYGPDADADAGWYVKRFEAVLRLDLERPELTEHRAIVARWDGLQRISARFSVPKHDGYALLLQDLSAQTRFGARIGSREQQSQSHFRFVLDLPRPLQRDEEHEYEIVFSVPANWPLQPHYAFVPLVACESFRLRVRFDPQNPPAAIWRLDGLAQRALDGRLTPGESLRLNPHGEAVLQFDRLKQGFAYGIEWLPAQTGAAAVRHDSCSPAA